jgi:hypothetical protein
MWEYKLKNISFRLYSQLIEELNIDGNENWEIISYEENKNEKYSGYTAKVLYKRIKSTINVSTHFSSSTCKKESQKPNIASV